MPTSRHRHPPRQPRKITPELISEALAFIPPDIDRDTWARVAMAIKSELSDSAGFDLWDEWSQRGETYDARNARDTWRSIKAGGRTTIGTLFGIAGDHGFKFPEGHEAEGVQTPAQQAAAAAEAERLAAEKRRRHEAEAAEYRRRAELAAREAGKLWAEGREDVPSPYLVRKGVQAHGVRCLADGTLLVPMHDLAGELHNVQRIAPQRPADGGTDKRFLPGGRKSGLLHLIGGPVQGADAALVPLLLLAEGYATGASLHEATGRPVAVCFDAGNMVNVARAVRERWPALPLLVCADNDLATEARTGRNPGRDKAATAARAAHSEAAACGVVWPEGLPEGATDFNDLAAHAGADVVRELVERAAASPSIPKPRRGAAPAAGEAIGGADGSAQGPGHAAGLAGPNSGPQPDHQSGRHAARAAGRAGDGGGSDDDDGRGDALAAAEDARFVLVTLDERVSPRDARCDRPGLWYVPPPDADGNRKRPMWLCAPLLVSAETRTDDGNGWGMLLNFTDGDGRRKSWAMPLALLTGDGTQWAARLRDMGLRMAPGTATRNRLAEYLDTRYLKERVTCVDRVGWHRGVYVLPGESIGTSETGERFVFQAESAVEDTFRQRGELAEWLRQVAAPCAGNSRLVFAVCCAFGGPLMSPLMVQTGGFHLVGDSSLGKTTALLVAASVWGPPGFKRQWRTTDNALEATAAQHSDCLLILDEIGQVDGRIAGECAYMLGNEQEKGRGQRTLQLRKPRTWRLLFLSSGEKTLADHMEEAGKRPNEGQLLRMPSVPADAGAGLGMLEVLHGVPDGKAFVEAITKATATYYGTAGAAWLQWLADHLAKVEDWTAALMARFEAEYVPGLAHSQVRRVAARFALVAAAGELATKAGLTGWVPGEAVQSARRCFDAWLTKRGHAGNGEKVAMLGQVKACLERNGDALFTALHRLADDHRANTPLRLGFRRVVDEDGKPVKLDAAQEYIDRRSTSESATLASIRWQYLILAEAFKRDVCKGQDPEAVAKLLRDRGHLMTDGDRLTMRQRINGIGDKVPVYLIKPSIFEDDGEGL